MFQLFSSGSFSKTIAYLEKLQRLRFSLEKYGQAGVAALASATPVDSGLTAASWTYEITIDGSSVSISWHNTNVVNGTPVAILLQYGHGTGTGGYVAGRDYINPAIQPIFEQIKVEVRKAVTA